MEIKIISLWIDKDRNIYLIDAISPNNQDELNEFVYDWFNANPKNILKDVLRYWNTNKNNSSIFGDLVRIRLAQDSRLDMRRSREEQSSSYGDRTAQETERYSPRGSNKVSNSSTDSNDIRAAAEETSAMLDNKSHLVDNIEDIFDRKFLEESVVFHK